MEYKTAKTYENWERIEKPFDKNGKLYTKVKEKCPRCSGLGIIVARVENGHHIPIPVDGGICYQCYGDKYITKEVRLYNEKEYNAIEIAKEKAAKKRKIEQEQKMKAEFQKNKEKWLSDNGFNAEGNTYIVTGETYSIKEELKAAGFCYSIPLQWHRATNAGYENNTILVNVKDVIEFSAWGQGYYLTSAREFVQNKLAETAPEEVSNWVGEIGKPLSATLVKLIKIGSFYGKYGLSYIYTFVTENDDLLIWFSSSTLKQEINDWFEITATIKNHDTYKNKKQTILKRVKVINPSKAE